MAAFYTACATFMGQNLGAKKQERVLKSYFIGITYSFVAGAVFGGALFLFGREFLSMFANDEAVIEAGLQRIKIMSFSYAVSAFMDCTIAALRPPSLLLWAHAYSVWRGYIPFLPIFIRYRPCICCIFSHGLSRLLRRSHISPSVTKKQTDFNFRKVAIHSQPKRAPFFGGANKDRTLPFRKCPFLIFIRK